MHCIQTMCWLFTEVTSFFFSHSSVRGCVFHELLSSRPSGISPSGLWLLPILLNPTLPSSFCSLLALS